MAQVQILQGKQRVATGQETLDVISKDREEGPPITPRRAP